jgi:hypothetical protein
VYHLSVKFVLELANDFLVLFDDVDVLLFFAEDLSQVSSDLACADDDYSHLSVSFVGCLWRSTSV